MADNLGNVSRTLVEQSMGAVVYFVSFVGISTILVLNVIVGVVVDSVADIKKEKQNKAKKQKAERVKDTDQNEMLLQELEKLELQLAHVKSMINEQTITDEQTD